MFFYSFLFLFFSILPCLFSAPKVVELVSNFPSDTAHLTSLLTKQNLDVQVINSDLSHYGIGTNKKPIFLEKWMNKWRLDFWKSISLSPRTVKLLFFNLNNHLRRDLYLHYLPKDKMCLFMWEPPAVLPQMYKRRTWQLFSKIYTWDDDLVDGVKFFKLYYPVLKPMLTDLPSFEDKKLCTFIGTCLTSTRAGCLYEERKKTIAFFESIDEKGFEFYGRKWEANQYKSYVGAVADKIAVMKHYRFCICYENSCDRNGYITEKIFDCFAAGCIPIYWGAPNVETYIPKDCFIDRRDFLDLQTLYTFLKSMSKEEYEGYLQRIRAYLDSEKAQLFSFAQFEKILFDAVYSPELGVNSSIEGGGI